MQLHSEPLNRGSDRQQLLANLRQDDRSWPAVGAGCQRVAQHHIGLAVAPLAVGGLGQQVGVDQHTLRREQNGFSVLFPGKELE